MTTVIENVLVGTTLDFDVSGYIIQPTRGTLYTADGTKTIAFGPPTAQRQVLLSDITTSSATNPSGLLWGTIQASDINLSGLAGDGLVYDSANGEIDVGESTLIGVLPDSVYIKSGGPATINQPLISSGTITTPPSYAALSLTGPGVSGILPVTRGGTGLGVLPLSSFLVSNATGTAVTGIAIADIQPIIATITTANATPTTIYTYTATSGNAYAVEAKFLAINTSGTGPQVFNGDVEASFNYVSTPMTKVGEMTKRTPANSSFRSYINTDGTNIQFVVQGQGRWKVRIEPILALA